jgi:hypothetical protein
VKRSEEIVEIVEAYEITRRDLDQFTVAQPPQVGHCAQRAARDHHRHAVRQDGKRPDVEMVGVQV